MEDFVDEKKFFYAGSSVCVLVCVSSEKLHYCRRDMGLCLRLGCPFL